MHFCFCILIDKAFQTSEDLRLSLSNQEDFLLFRQDQEEQLGLHRRYGHFQQEDGVLAKFEVYLQYQG